MNEFDSQFLLDYLINTTIHQLLAEAFQKMRICFDYHDFSLPYFLQMSASEDLSSINLTN